jgi:4-hydroxy-3-polyprenylbenzoate decarboxylase
VVKIKDEVDWDIEAGAIVRRTCEREGPAVLFENVKDYPGQRLFGAPLATYRRFAIALGLDVNTPPGEIHAEFEKRWEHPIKPIVVKDGPCKENIITDEKVNLFDFPVPMVHEGDGHRYIGTWHAVISRDPDTDWVNWGMYRLALHTRRYIGCQMLTTSDMGQIFFGKYVPKGKAMPVAVALGMDPLSSYAAMQMVGVGVDEASMSGGWSLEPVELVKAETSDILVPAHAEIILEGEMPTNDLADEGPFGEYTGYRTSPRRPMPVIRINCITHRNNPILAMSNMGIPVDESGFGYALGLSYSLKKRLRELRIPAKDVYVPPHGCAHLAIVSVPRERKYSNIAVQIGDAISGIGAIPGVPSTVIVVDDDVDIYNINEVLHALMTKCHPLNGITASKCPSVPLVPFLSLEDRLWSRGARVTFDCTWPPDWPVEVAIPTRSSFRDIYPKDVQEKVEKNWRKWGFS